MEPKKPSQRNCYPFSGPFRVCGPWSCATGYATDSISPTWRAFSAWLGRRNVEVVSIQLPVGNEGSQILHTFFTQVEGAIPPPQDQTKTMTRSAGNTAGWPLWPLGSRQIDVLFWCLFTPEKEHQEEGVVSEGNVLGLCDSLFGVMAAICPLVRCSGVLEFARLAYTTMAWTVLSPFAQRPWEPLLLPAPCCLGTT